MTLKELLLYKKKVATQMSKCSEFMNSHKVGPEDRPTEVSKMMETRLRWSEYKELVAEMVRVKNVLAETNMQVGIIHKLNQLNELMGLATQIRSIGCDPDVIERSQGYNAAPKEVEVQTAFSKQQAEEIAVELEDKISKLHNEIDTLNFTTKVDFVPSLK